MNLTGISRRSLAQNRHSPVNKNVPKRSNHVWEKEQEIIAALEKDPHASRVARALGDVSYATASRIADRNAIALAAGRETMGRRLPPDRRAAGIEGRPGQRGCPAERDCAASRRQPVKRAAHRREWAPAEWRSSQRRGAPNGGYAGNVAEQRFAAIEIGSDGRGEKERHRLPAPRDRAARLRAAV